MFTDFDTESTDNTATVSEANDNSFTAAPIDPNPMPQDDQIQSVADLADSLGFELVEEGGFVKVPSNINPDSKERKDLRAYWTRIDQIVIDPDFNVRADYGDLDSLAMFIAEGGKLPPLLLGTIKGIEGKVVIDGHRRYFATHIAIKKYGATDLEYLPSTIEQYTTKADALLAQIARNSGKPQSKLEQGLIFIKLTAFGLTQGDIARKLGKTQAYVSQAISLGHLPPTAQEHVKSGAIAPSVALEIVRKTSTHDEAAQVIEGLVKDHTPETIEVNQVANIEDTPVAPTPKKKKVTAEAAAAAVSGKSAEDLFSEHLQTIQDFAATAEGDFIAALSECDSQTVARIAKAISTDKKTKANRQG